MKAGRKHSEDELRGHGDAFRWDAGSLEVVAGLLLELVHSSPRKHRSCLICGGKPSQNSPVCYFAMPSPQKMKKVHVLLELPAVTRPSRGHTCGGLFQAESEGSRQTRHLRFL